MMTTSDVDNPARTTVRIPSDSGGEIDAWLYRPDGDGPHPAVVLAHGIGAIKAGGLAPFAERFCREGFAAIAFDYRQWGASTGEPREELSVPRQRDDYSTVIGWAAAHPDIDAQRPGTIAQSPLVDGLAAARLAPPIRSLRLLSVAVRDRIGAIFAGPPRYLPGAGAPGELAIGATEDALFGEKLMTHFASPTRHPVQSSIAVAAATTTSTKGARTTTTCCASRSTSSAVTHHSPTR
jgi:fermentation-respiration switch protein FrsA (DUF1100 family)